MSHQLTPDKFLNDMEYDRFSQNLTRWADRSPRNTLIFSLLLNTGARPQELLNLTTKDLVYESSGVFIRGLKGSNSRTIPLSPDLWKRLLFFARTAGPDGFLFPIHYRTLVSHWRKYRPCKKALRSTRHTFAVRLYKRTRDIRLVQWALGHKASSNTDIYLDFVYGTDEIKKALGV